MSAAPVSVEDDLHWLALHLVPGMGPRRTHPLLKKLRTPQAIFRCSRSSLIAEGVPPSAAQTISSGCTFDDAAGQLDQIKAHGAALLTYSDARYPERLREIIDPPIVLFAKGRVELAASPTIAVVGTRRPSAYGSACAERLAGDLSLAGFTIVSGMARGIDTSAHRAALNNGGKTIAVFGCGIDVIYPAENRKLAGQIAQEGLILSEFAMGTPGHPQNFPVRNRVISGLSAGVLVVEGAQYSGSAITARMAMEQNRPVFAVPGNITSKMSWGTNLLIKEGAKLVQAAEDVVTELSIEDRQAAAGQSKLPFDESPSPEQQLEQVLGPAAHIGKAVLKELQVDQPVHLDELIERSANASPSELIAALFQLEMIQLVRQLPGRNYVRVW